MMHQAPLQIKDWNSYVGDIWKTIFIKTGIRKNSTIIELAPGKEDKIGRGLAELDFHGILYIIEPDKGALDVIMKKYKKIMSGATIIGLPFSLKNAIYLPENVDVIVSNHPLDDMIIHKFLGNISCKYFSEYYNDKECKNRVFWESLMKDRKRLDEINKEIILDWRKLIVMTKPKKLLISQYESYFFKEHGLSYPDECAFELLEKIRRLYDEYEAAELLQDERIIDKKRWLALSFEKQKNGK